MSTPVEQWWVIHGEEFLRFLQRAHEGEAPELLFIEAFANSKTERY